MSEVGRIQANIAIGKPVSKAVPKKNDEPKPELQAQAPVTTPKSADDVLNFLADSSQFNSSNIGKTGTSQIQVSKYITPEQAARIGKSVNVFFDGMDKQVAQALKEFPNLTSSQAQNLVAFGVTQKMDEEVSL